MHFINKQFSITVLLIIITFLIFVFLHPDINLPTIKILSSIVRGDIKEINQGINITECYAKDRFSVYYIDHYDFLDVSKTYHKIKKADPDTFKALNVYGGCYGIDRKNIYVNKTMTDILGVKSEAKYAPTVIIKNIDINSFKILNFDNPKWDTTFAVDKNAAYLLDRKEGLVKIKEADSLSFKLLGEGWERSVFAIDNKNVYFHRSSMSYPVIINNVNIETVKVFHDTPYALDKNFVYIIGGMGDKEVFKKIDGADPSTFKIINEHKMIKGGAVDINNNYEIDLKTDDLIITER